MVRQRLSPACLSLVVVVVLFGVNLSLYVSIRAMFALEAHETALTIDASWRERALAAEAALATQQQQHALPEMYGSSPRVVGLETCAAFRSAVPQHMRRWAAAGTFNSGTNTLQKLMKLNCQFDARRLLWQAPWGKHNPMSWRGDHWAPMFKDSRPDVATVMPTVVIKDPLTWMKSMCRNVYETNFKRHPKHKTEECPSPVDRTKTVVRFQPTRHGSYSSLPAFWGEWNSDYLKNASFPRLIVRFEDLLFDTERTVKTVCECVGGTMKPRFTQEELASKTQATGHKGPVNDREGALRLYSSERERYLHYTEADLRFISDVLKPTGLLDLFNYDFDTTLRSRRQMSRRRRRRLMIMTDENNRTLSSPVVQRKRQVLR